MVIAIEQTEVAVWASTSQRKWRDSS